MNNVYEYKKKLPHTPHGRGEQETPIADAERRFVYQYIPKEEFQELFGGYLYTDDKERQTHSFPYIGVWGKDKIRKFKRMLCERGAEFEVCTIEGSARSILVTAK